MVTFGYSLFLFTGGAGIGLIALGNAVYVKRAVRRVAAAVPV